ncbi:MAG: HNH endonuclease [Desulfobacterales bacterium]
MYIPEEEEIRKEKAKARQLRATQWWKRKCARGICHYCGRQVPPGELTMDHIIPISRGGKSTRSNVVPCCKDCNTQKKSRLPMEWNSGGGS